ncbi:MAG: hypothetical protein QM813_11045 [Verrucomicrobiota bacterium]
MRLEQRSVALNGFHGCLLRLSPFQARLQAVINRLSHVGYLKSYWHTNRIKVGARSSGLMASDFDPPAGYGYKWKAD